MISPLPIFSNMDYYKNSQFQQTVQYSTLKYNTVKYSKVQYTKVRYVNVPKHQVHIK